MTNEEVEVCADGEERADGKLKQRILFLFPQL